MTAAFTAVCGSAIGTDVGAESGKPASGTSVREQKVSTAAAKTSLTEEEKLFIRIYKASNRGVVNISTVSSAEEMMTNAVPADGFGSGFIIGTEGYILTNHHVVRGSDHLLVTLYDGSTVQAGLVGYDSQTDLGRAENQAPQRHHPHTHSPGRLVLSRGRAPGAGHWESLWFRPYPHRRYRLFHRTNHKI
ncbi:MAG: trypsin-like peptidase domain-containing protein [Candidatus Obscuribacter sp.]|nr:trypsin-like peptidase domain-containing protein [Candidatus Obscuribacter sp.]